MLRMPSTVNLRITFVEQQHKDKLLSELKMINWGETVPLNHDKTSQLLKEFEQKSANKIPASPLRDHQPLINTFVEKEELTQILAAILTLDTEDKWLVRAQKSLKNGSPLSAQLAFTQLNKGKGMSLAECFRMELDLAVKCGCFGEFSEGVRALLIDRDKSPKWRYSSVEVIDTKVLNWFFESSWSKAEHPLAKLS